MADFDDVQRGRWRSARPPRHGPCVQPPGQSRHQGRRVCGPAHHQDGAVDEFVPGPPARPAASRRLRRSRRPAPGQLEHRQCALRRSAVPRPDSGRCFHIGSMPAHIELAGKPGSRTQSLARRPRRGPMQARMAPEVFQVGIPWPPATASGPELPRLLHAPVAHVVFHMFRRSAARRSRAVRSSCPCEKNFGAALFGLLRKVNLASLPTRLSARQGSRRSSTISSASSSTVSGTVSWTRMPVMAPTVPFRLSRCCTFIADQTSMPASSNSCTSCQRLPWREPSTLECANSSPPAERPACVPMPRQDRTP